MKMSSKHILFGLLLAAVTVPAFGQGSGVLCTGTGAAMVCKEINCSDGKDNDNDGLIDCYDGDCTTNSACKNFFVSNSSSCQTLPNVNSFAMKQVYSSPNGTADHFNRVSVGDLDGDAKPEIISFVGRINTNTNTTVAAPYSNTYIYTYTYTYTVTAYVFTYTYKKNNSNQTQTQTITQTLSTPVTGTAVVAQTGTSSTAPTAPTYTDPVPYTVTIPAAPAAPSGYTFKSTTSSSTTVVNNVTVSVSNVNSGFTPTSGATLYVLNGGDGSIINRWSMSSPYSTIGNYTDPVIGKTDSAKATLPWIFIGATETTAGSGYSATTINSILAFDRNLNLKWSSNTAPAPASGLNKGLAGTPAMFGLTDFNHDGHTEIYSRNEIIDAATGKKLATGAGSGSSIADAPVAVDIDTTTPELELIAGGIIYHVTATGTYPSQTWTITKWKSIDGSNSWTYKNIISSQADGSTNTAPTTNANAVTYKTGNGPGFTSVADYNHDGALDVIATGGYGSYTAEFWWDLKNNKVTTYVETITSISYPDKCATSGVDNGGYDYGWNKGNGRVNIADVDGDGKLNASYVAGRFVYVLDENFNKKYRKEVNEETSGYTGCTVYDFNGDGASEIVYRDEQYLYILSADPVNGLVAAAPAQKCISRTQVEYPIVVDVNGDGATEICVTCATNDALGWDNFCDTDYSVNSTVRAYASDLNAANTAPWIPSRPVWNQHAYFNVNVNNDLSIPVNQQPIWTVWNNTMCNGLPIPSQPMNTFLNQAPRMDTKGCPVYVAPDLTVVNNVNTKTTVAPPTCPDADFYVSMTIQNQGGIGISQQNVPISFYNGNPTKAGAVRLGTVIKQATLGVSDTISFKNMKVTGTGGSFTLYVVLNDPGTEALPITFPITGSMAECTYTNDMDSAKVVPNPNPIDVQKISDNISCSADKKNGAAKAYVKVNGVRDSTNYTYYWYNGTSTTGTPAYTGQVYSNLTAGTYSVYAVNNHVNCGSKPETVTISTVTETPMRDSIVQISPNTSCVSPNGALRAVVNATVVNGVIVSAAPVNNYTYQWYKANVAFTTQPISIADTATNLMGLAGTGQVYTVAVTSIKSGCLAITTNTLFNNTINPSISAPTIVNTKCVPDNTGSVAVSASGGTGTVYTFNWYNGTTTKPVADYTPGSTSTNSTYSSLVTGSYTVTATDNMGCTSAPVTATVGLPPVFTVTASPVSQQTSCTSTALNGSVTASVSGGVSGDTYTYTWYKGQSTAAANEIAAASTPGLASLAAGDYTVVATDNTTGCTANNYATILQKQVFPTVDKTKLTANPNSICAATGGVQYNGSITASAGIVAYDGSTVASPYTGFQFTWYKGSTATGTAYATTATPTLTNLNGGDYTMVVTATATDCAVQIPPMVSVLNSPETFTITPNPTPSTNCPPTAANGKASVSVSSTNVAGTFTYQWYTGSVVAPAAKINGATSATVSNVQGGSSNNYTVVITDIQTQCVDTTIVRVTDGKALPTLSLATAPNGVCDPALGYNGSIIATVSNQGTALLSDYKFSSISTSTGSNVGAANSGNTAWVYNKLQDATYTPITVTQISTGCVSSDYNTTVGNAQPVLNIKGNSTPSTNCDVAHLTTITGGSAFVTGVTQTTGIGNYTYQWYTGSSAVPAALISTSTNATANTATLSKVQGGPGTVTSSAQFYTVLVTDKNSGCTKDTVMQVTESIVLPTLSFVIVPNGVCDPAIGYSGSITAAVSNQGSSSFSDYKFSSIGTSTGTNAGAANSGNTAWFYNKLQDATYTPITVTQNSTGCVSSDYNATVGNAQPELIITSPPSTPSVNCDAAHLNATTGGSASVTVTQTTGTGSYLYQWHSGSTTKGVSIGSNNKTITGQQGGDTSNPLGTGLYTVLVKDQSTGCIDSTTVQIADGHVTPTISLSKSDNTICTPLVGALKYDGSVTTTITNQGSYALTDYAFTYTGGGTQTPSGKDLKGSPTANVWNQLNGGSTAYNVQVANNVTGCQSSPVNTIVVNNSLTLPKIKTDSIPSTNCTIDAAHANGQAMVSAISGVAGTDVNSGYTYAWTWAGTATPAPSVSGTTNTLTKVQGGTGADYGYQVTVTDQINGCVSTKIVQVTDNSKLPVITLQETDNKNCTSGTIPVGIKMSSNGSASLKTLTDANANATDTYNYVWSNGVTGATATSAGINLAADIYTLTVTNTVLGCTSLPVSTTVKDDLFIPPIAFNPTAPQTSCDLTKPNGSITASIDETSIGGNNPAANPSDYDYAWVNGSSTSVGNTQQITGLAADTYFVTVTRTATGCQYTNSMTLIDQVAPPVVNSITPVAQTNCNALDGSITADVTVASGIHTTFTYYWMLEQPNTVTTDTATVINTVKASPVSPNALHNSTSTTDVDAGLFYGTYTLVVKDDYTKCISQTATATVIDNTESKIDFDITGYPTVCADKNGSVDIKANRVDGQSTTFMFTLHEGGPTNTVSPINFYTNPPVYDPTIDVSPFPLTVPVSGTVNSNTSVNTMTSTGVGLPSDIFTIEATDGLGCKSLQTFFLPFQHAHDIDTATVGSTLCVGGNGSITISAIPADNRPNSNQTEFTYFFYKGSNHNPTKLISPPSPVTYPTSGVNCSVDPTNAACTQKTALGSLVPGFYTVGIQENYTGAGCIVYQTLEIKQLSLSPVISASITSNDNCDPAANNGQIKLYVDKAPNDQNTGAITYNVTMNGTPLSSVPNVTPMPVVTTPIINETIAGLTGQGTSYTFVAIDPVTQCTSTRSYTVYDSLIYPEFAPTPTDAESCTPSLEQSAKVVISTVNVPGTATPQPMGDYQFDWYNSANTNMLSGLGNNQLDNTTSTLGAGSVVAGTYSVKLTRKNGTDGIGCTTAHQVTIFDKHVNPVLSFATTPQTSCDTNFDGAITVMATTTSALGTSAIDNSNYNFHWTNDPDGLVSTTYKVTDGIGVAYNAPYTVPASPTDKVGAGIYNITVTNVATGCSTDSTKNVEKLPVSVTVTNASASPLQSCSTVTPDGSVTLSAVNVTVNGTADAAASVLSNFTYKWTTDLAGTTLVTTIPSAVVGGVPVGTSVADLPNGDYYITVKKDAVTTSPASGCSSSPYKVTVDDKRVYPTVAFTPTPNDACDTNYNGAITITAATASGPGAVTGTNYNFHWTNDPDGLASTTYSAVDGLSSSVAATPTQATYTTLSSDKIGAGSYAITVTNQTTKCAVDGSVTVDQKPIVVTVAKVDSTNQLTCLPTPNGSATVAKVNLIVNGTTTTSYPLTDFSYKWNTAAITTGITGLSAGSYSVVATRKSGATPGSGCVSAPHNVSIIDKHTDPTVSLAPFTNTSCSTTTFEGHIEVTASDSEGLGVGQPYIYVWTSSPMGVNMVSAGPTYIGNADATQSNLKDGTYNIRVTNTMTNCYTDAQAIILKSATPIIVASTYQLDQTLCAPLNGYIKVDSVQVGNGTVPIKSTDPLFSDFSFTWSPGASTTNVLSGLGAGTYSVTATRTAGSPGLSCVSAPLNVTIQDKRVYPTVSLTSFTNTSCSTTAFEGSIKVNAIDSAGPGVGKTYNYTWDAGNPSAIAMTSGSGVNNTTAANLKDGTYNLIVTNSVTNCSTPAQTIILQSNTPILALDISVVDQALCNPDGSIKVGNVFVDNAPDPVLSDFTFDWYKNDPTSTSIESGVGVNVLDKTNYPTIGQGTYYVTATRTTGAPGEGCISPPVSADIRDVHVDPTIANGTIDPNINCNGATAGTGSVTINEATPANYTYTWFEGDNTLGTPLSAPFVTGSNGQNLQTITQGDYTLKVRDNATNCVSVAGYAVPVDSTIVSFDISTFSAPDLTTCDATTGKPNNGSAVIADMLENEVSAPMTNYNFVWLDSTNVNINPHVLQNSATATLSNIPKGNYFVYATNTVSNCKADMSFSLRDSTVGTTSVKLLYFQSPYECLGGQQGHLTVIGGGNAGSSYSYTWYAGNLPTSLADTSLMKTSASDSTIYFGNSLTGGVYNVYDQSANELTNPDGTVYATASDAFTIKVINGVNGCWALADYNVPLLVDSVYLSTSTYPLTFCRSNNGEAFATTVNDSKFNYDFYWNTGVSVDTVSNYINPQGKVNDYKNLPAGTYTVIAADKRDRNCVTKPKTVKVQDMRVTPVATAQMLKALTICDTTINKPDGVAYASVAGDVVDYTFKWYVGAPVDTTTVQSFDTGASVGGLMNLTYTVYAISNATGCADSASVSVPTNFAKIPVPIVAVVSNKTSCVDNNGELSASVDGNTKDYIFYWDNGNNTPTLDQYDYEGAVYDSLDVGSYTVVADSRETGCVSGPAVGTISKEQTFPKLDFMIQSANCSDNNGGIAVIVTNGAAISSITWAQNGVTQETGPNLEEATAGDYTVTVISTLGCETTQDVVIPVDIKVYNGVSRNGDGKNDIFQISCIENFPTNRVEIFNRNGTKVYEANGYNNSDVLFDGKSNRGISVMGTDLPPGTYFYIIYKNDGSKPVVGYLELVD